MASSLCSAQPVPHALCKHSPQPLLVCPFAKQRPPARAYAPQPLVQRSCRSLQRRSTQETREAALWGREQPPSPGPKKPPGGDDDSDEGKGWGVFDKSRYAIRWNVPWGAGKVAGGMALWFGTFVGVGFVLVPQLYRAAGLTIYELSPEDKATFTLVCQLVETGVSLALIRALTAKDIETSGAKDFFNFDPREPFTKPRGWLAWGLLGMALSPVVVGSVAALLSFTGYDNVGGQGTVDGVATMIDLDLPTYVSLVAVTGVLAPLLEETVFRGFLLTSLTRFMPTWAALVASSVAFGVAHLSARDLPVLCALGMLLGASYIRTRNLLTPMLIHGAWNSSVLTLLFWLTAQGVDVQSLLEEVRTGAGG